MKPGSLILSVLVATVLAVGCGTPARPPVTLTLRTTTTTAPAERRTVLTAAVVPPVPATGSPAAEVAYSTCDDARAAGAAPILAGEPGYRDGLDRDGDGTACDEQPTVDQPAVKTDLAVDRAVTATTTATATARAATGTAAPSQTTARPTTTGPATTRTTAAPAATTAATVPTTAVPTIPAALPPTTTTTAPATTTTWDNGPFHGSSCSQPGVMAVGRSIGVAPGLNPLNLWCYGSWRTIQAIAAQCPRPSMWLDSAHTTYCAVYVDPSNTYWMDVRAVTEVAAAVAAAADRAAGIAVLEP